MMRQEEPGLDGPLAPLDLRKIALGEAAATSDRRGWVGLDLEHTAVQRPASELSLPAIAHHRLVLFIQPPEELDLLYEGVKRHVPPPAGAISLVPAGMPFRWRAKGRRETLHIYLEPDLVAQVATLAFDLDPARLTVPPLDGLDQQHLRNAMSAIQTPNRHAWRRRARLAPAILVPPSGRPPDPAHLGPITAVARQL